MHAIDEDGRITKEKPLQILPTARGCHSVRTDPTNKFAYATCIATGGTGRARRFHSAL